MRSQINKTDPPDQILGSAGSREGREQTNARLSGTSRSGQQHSRSRGFVILVSLVLAISADTLSQCTTSGIAVWKKVSAVMGFVAAFRLPEIADRLIARVRQSGFHTLPVSHEILAQTRLAKGITTYSVVR